MTFPFSRIKMIMKSSPDVTSVSPESINLVSKATVSIFASHDLYLFKNSFIKKVQKIKFCYFLECETVLILSFLIYRLAEMAQA